MAHATQHQGCTCLAWLGMDPGYHCIRHRQEQSWRDTSYCRKRNQLVSMKPYPPDCCSLLYPTWKEVRLVSKISHFELDYFKISFGDDDCANSSKTITSQLRIGVFNEFQANSPRTKLLSFTCGLNNVDSGFDGFQLSTFIQHLLLFNVDDGRTHDGSTKWGICHKTLDSHTKYAPCNMTLIFIFCGDFLVWGRFCGESDDFWTALHRVTRMGHRDATNHRSPHSALVDIY